MYCLCDFQVCTMLVHFIAHCIKQHSLQVRLISPTVCYSMQQAISRPPLAIGNALFLPHAADVDQFVLDH